LIADIIRALDGIETARAAALDLRIDWLADLTGRSVPQRSRRKGRPSRRPFSCPGANCSPPIGAAAERGASG
jgi:hypothetical protein